MRWTKASGALILLTACLAVSTLLLPKRRERRFVPLRRVDREGVPLPSLALARLGGTRWRHAGAVCCLAYSPSGNLLASGGEDHLVRLWDAHSGTEVRRLAGHTHAVESVAFSADGAVLASSSFGGTIRLWHIASGRLLQKIQVGYYCRVTFSGDGRTLAVWDSWSSFRDSRGSFRLWDVSERRWLPTIPPEGEVLCVVVSPRGRLLVLTSDSTIQLRDAATGTRLCQLDRGDISIEVAALSPDGATLATVDSEGSIRLWNTHTGRVLHHIETSAGQFRKLIVSRHATALISVVGYDSVRVWDVARGNELHVLTRGRELVNDLCLSPDGQRLAAAVDSIIYLWDLDSGKRIHPVTDRELPICSARFARHERSLILRGEDGSIRIRDWATGHERHCWRSAAIGEFGSPLPVALSPDGRFLAEAIDEKTICLRDVQSNKKVRTFPTAKEVWNLHFSPNGEILVGSTSERDQLWSLRTGKEMRLGEIPFETLRSLLFSPDGRWFASPQGIFIDINGQTRNVYLWDRITGRIVYAIKGQGSRITLHGFSPDGRILAGTDNDKRNSVSQLVLWDTTTGSERLRLPAFGESIQAMAFSPDGRTLALGCGDGIIRLWEVATGEVRQSLSGDQGRMRALAFSHDGDLLASTGENKTVLVWDVNQRRQAEETRSISGHELDECWRALLDFDAARAFKAQQTLASAPRSALEFLRRRLHPVVPPEPERVRRLIADLDSENYPTRERAMRQLEHLGDGTEGYLRRVLRQRPSLEVRRRVERLLEMLAMTSPRHLRDGRLLEVLEWLEVAEARRLLEELADGATDAWLTREAKAALTRRTAPEWASLSSE